MKVGYARVSTVEQNEARQYEMFKNEGIEKVFLDKMSGKDTNRPQLKEMLTFLREGDCLVVESMVCSTDAVLWLVVIHGPKCEVKSVSSDVDKGTAALLMLVEEYAPCGNCTASQSDSTCVVDITEGAGKSRILEVL